MEYTSTLSWKDSYDLVDYSYTAKTKLLMGLGEILNRKAFWDNGVLIDKDYHRLMIELLLPGEWILISNE